ncbi:hypothetical protein GCM10009828_083800 [Actinoplanes couchii]|uniref:Uncharacterized protein n=2 Tax=Actinoplanes couchii TaxID=403638 RepID=A0ABQ3XNR2_9ACTN|nr:hypothetical protein Aco03nite_085630 [Actinoplanes couchii]
MRGARLTYRVSEHRLDGDVHPDEVARRLAGSGQVDVLHSTSWRFEAGRIVLTYVALPDPDPHDATDLDPATGIVSGDDPLSPSPAHVERTAVAAHACRHLAFLRHTDPLVAGAALRQPRLWALLDGFRPTVAGALR